MTIACSRGYGTVKRRVDVVTSVEAVISKVQIFPQAPVSIVLICIRPKQFHLPRYLELYTGIFDSCMTIYVRILKQFKKPLIYNTVNLSIWYFVFSKI